VIFIGWLDLFGKGFCHRRQRIMSGRISRSLARKFAMRAGQRGAASIHRTAKKVMLAARTSKATPVEGGNHIGRKPASSDPSGEVFGNIMADQVHSQNGKSNSGQVGKNNDPKYPLAAAKVAPTTRVIPISASKTNRHARPPRGLSLSALPRSRHQRGRAPFFNRHKPNPSG
jgi:hypothetical protein